MPKTIQIRDIPDDVYAGLVRRAAETSVSVPTLLRDEAARLARQPSMAAWISDVRRSPLPAGTDVVSVLDELRGPWPDAGR